MTEEQVKALLLLANIEYKGLFKIANEYYPDNVRFVEERANDPWWLFITNEGDPIKIGWRKRVISIDWSATTLRINPKGIDPKHSLFEFPKERITQDDVTQWETGVHAWGYGKAISYLQELKLRLTQNRYAESEEGKKDLAGRRLEFEKVQAWQN